jgi:tetraacyldisaccharide 4'-kinase
LIGLSDTGIANLNQAIYRKIISGQITGPSATLARGILSSLSVPYGLAVRIRNSLYASGRLRARQVAVPVICVGNLTTGGTGKTPLVAWLAGAARDKGQRPAILTRGYRTDTARLSDEPAELVALCPDAPVIVNPDRVAGAEEAIGKHGAEVLLMDDGFQHRRLARDLDIVTIDATAPFGYGHLLPAGLLREPVSELRRAQAVVLTRCDQVQLRALETIEERVREISPLAVVARAIHAPAQVERSDGSRIALEELKGQRVFAFCGLGNPQAFFETVRRLSCVLAGSRTFDDHHEYTDGCLAQILAEARRCDAELTLTTRKDWTKAVKLNIGDAAPPFACLSIRMELIAGASALTTLIEEAMAGRMPNRQG